MTFLPSRMFFTKGVGVHKEYLNSFELALRDAKIETSNIVTVSSIMPAGCEIVDVEQGAAELIPGQITFAVLARTATNEHNRLIAASIGVAKPVTKNRYGYLSEHHPFGQDAETAGDYAEDLAATMLASSLGLELDPNTSWDDKEEVFRLSGKVFETYNVTQSAVGQKELWTTVISAGVFLP